jgi:zinc protease
MVSTLMISLSLLDAAPAQTADAALVAKVKASFDSVREAKLPNGLRVYLLPIPGSPVVTTMTAYKVGGCDEDKSATGLSHYLEHLLFKGTDKLKPGDVDRLTQRNGGMNNAYTSEDMTVYHFDFAADRWTIALEIEADRMRNTRIDAAHEFEQEKGAVISELKRNEDGPWDLEYKAILKALYPKEAPYAHPVIGEESHVREATAEVITRYYDRWYHPNNAALVIVGGFDPDKAMKDVERLFGPIKKGELPPRKTNPPVPPRDGPVRSEFKSKFDVPRGMLGFNTCLATDPDAIVLSVIGDVLAGGKSSRLYRKMVEGERIAGAIDADTNGGRYPGWFGVMVELLPGKERPKAEQLIFAELADLAAKPVSDAELARVKRQLLAAYVFQQESVHAVCDTIAKAVTYADLDFAKNYLPKLLAVTPADIQRVAAKYLTAKQSCVVWSVPAEAKGTAPAAPAAKPSLRRNRFDAPAAGAIGPDLTKVKRTVLPNGLTVLAFENRRLPIVVAEAYFGDLRMKEPAAKAGVAALMSDLMTEGTTTRSSEQIANAIESVGGTLGYDLTSGSMKVLSNDLTLGLDLFFDTMLNPTFPAEPFAQFKDQQLANIADADTQPQVKARKLFAQTVYGDHPFGRPRLGTAAAVAKLTPADCKALHTHAIVPNTTTLVVVGDIDGNEITAEIAKRTANWKAVPKGLDAIPAPPAIEQPPTKIVTDPEASQTHVLVGHLGITRDDPDYYTLLVMDNVLGTGPGFTDRLSSTLRDRQGLAYTVNASISSSADEQRGLFLGYIGTFPDKYVWVRDGFLKEINRIRDEPATEQEVDDAKKYLLGSLPFRLNSNAAIAGQLLVAERNKLGFGLLDDFRKKVSAVTVADVQAAARKHLDPKKLAIVAVGPIQENGKPVEKK